MATHIWVKLTQVMACLQHVWISKFIPHVIINVISYPNWDKGSSMLVKQALMYPHPVLTGRYVNRAVQGHGFLLCIITSVDFFSLDYER